MRPKLDELNIVLSNFQPDITCLTETWLTPEVESNLLHIEGLTLFRNDRVSRRGGGTAIYLREDLSAEAINVNGRLSEEAEGTFVDLPTLNLSVFCVYVPPNLSSNSLKTIKDDIISITDEHLTLHSNRNFMILGDFNHFDVCSLSSELSLTDIVDQPTRGANILDHILVSEDLKSHYVSSNVKHECPIGNSDHLSLIATPINQLHKLNNVRFHTVYDYRSSNLQRLLANAELVDWNSFKTSEEDANQLWRRLHSCIRSLIDSSIPQETVFLTAKDQCWMTPLTKLLINRKWSAYRSKDWNLYHHLKRKAKEEIKKAKLLWTRKLKDSSPKGFWNITSHLSGKRKRNDLRNLLMNESSPASLAETIAATITSDGFSYSNHHTYNDDGTWKLTFSEFEVQKCLQKLSPSKAAGPEDIPNKIYSLLAPFIAGALKAIFERSISDRTFLSDWKKAIVVPIPKTHPPVLQKLRAISLLSTPSKIFENLILRKMFNQMVPLFGRYQHAFRPSASTTTALLQLMDTATLIFDDTNYRGLAILSVDMSKAFDKVDHRILLQKASATLPRGFIAWLETYLSGRTFQVKIQGQLSRSYPVSLGVPQGSVLGPALFSILVGDLPCADSLNTFVQYADDLNIILPLTSDNPSYIKTKLLEQLEDIAGWCSRNKQHLNDEKTKVLLSTRRQVDFDDSLPIKRVTSLTVLGVTINDQLSWSDHITNVCKRACQRLHVIRKVKPYMNENELHATYCGFIRSIFDYCCPVFVFLPKFLCDRIRRVERRSHKIIYGKDFECTCQLDGLTHRRQDLSIKLLHNILVNKQHLLHSRAPIHLPHSIRFSNFTCRTDRRQHSFFPYVTLLMNSRLPRKF